MQYPKEIYHHASRTYRPVWGQEEHAKFNAQGWADEKQEGVVYRVYHATPVAVEAEPESEPTGEPRKCKNCGEVGHNARSCQKRP